MCDSVEYFRNKIRADVDQWQQRYAPNIPGNLAEELNIETIDSYIGPGYALGYPELYKSIRYVAQIEGVILDPVYTGKAFHGMLEEIKLGKCDTCSDIIFVHTGGVFGLFPHRNALVT